jgi:heme-degrading monooxygenase HmoA
VQEKKMFAVIFEVNRKPDRKDDYLESAKQLKPILQKIDGFIDNERFESQIKAGWLLSHSTWRDEKSVVRWRTEGEHHQVQKKGRFDIFQDYHLRVGEIVSDTAPPPSFSLKELRFDESEAGAGKYASFTEFFPHEQATFGVSPEAMPAHLGLSLSAEGLVDHEIYKSISMIYPDAKEYRPGKLALLAGWKTKAAAMAWTPRECDGIKEIRHRIVRVVRDYGMFDRREAPQYYADVEGAETTHPEPTR